MPAILMTFDLKDSEDADYEKGYDALLAYGLSRLSTNEKLQLPRSTVLGDTTVGETAEAIRDALKKILEDATKRKVDRLLVAVVSDWACIGTKDRTLVLREIVQRILINRERETDEG